MFQLHVPDSGAGCIRHLDVLTIMVLMCISDFHQLLSNLFNTACQLSELYHALNSIMKSDVHIKKVRTCKHNCGDLVQSYC